MRGTNQVETKRWWGCATDIVVMKIALLLPLLLLVPPLFLLPWPPLLLLLFLNSLLCAAQQLSSFALTAQLLYLGGTKYASFPRVDGEYR